MRFTRLANL
uniref:Uncharacterized protein n=1 Tax=Arundo donax TaxID=35708 RepID=A0A0A8YDP6_ARUDO